MSSTPSEQDPHKRWRIVHEKSVNKALAAQKINIRIRTDSTSGEQQGNKAKNENGKSTWVNEAFETSGCIRLIVQNLLQFHLLLYLCGQSSLVTARQRGVFIYILPIVHDLCKHHTCMPVVLGPFTFRSIIADHGCPTAATFHHFITDLAFSGHEQPFQSIRMMTLIFNPWNWPLYQDDP